MTDASTLLSDQVFQLNTFLWALEDLPDESQIQPVLRQAGYYLGSIGRSVLMPSGERAIAALTNLTGSADRSPCRPDLWLRHSSDPVQPIVELKARGFSPDSSNRRQALKLIAAAFNLAPSLAEPGKRPGHVLYATTAADADGLASTLKDLAQSLVAENAPAAPTGAIGLSLEAEGVALSSPNPADLPTALGAALANRPIVLQADGENDVQPLYFVPWMPGIDDSQEPELRSSGLQELTARVLTHMLAAVGRARPPTTLMLDGTRLLSAATFGVFDQWRDTDRQEFSEAVGKIVDRALKPVVEVRRVSGDCREVDLPNAEVQDAVTDRLERADPANPATNLETAVEEPATLFDEL